jgi:Kef-type K+ transport system membrane component KefB/nucleotide-binding universal stress UspA family protein
MHDPFLPLLVQIAVILLTARLVGGFMQLIGQPRVVGEMLGGIILGPSVLGLVYHSAWLHLLFPAGKGSDPYPYLNVLSQLGVVLYMFLVGLELDMKRLRNQGRALLLTGSASIFGPLICGLLLGLALFHELHGPSGDQWVFALFIGVAMCITAFPVLARMINERNLQNSPVGLFTLACGALNDVVGWCLLALIIAISTSTGMGSGHAGHPLLSAFFTLLYTGIFAAFMLMVMPKFLRGLQNIYERRGYLSLNTLGLILLLVLACSAMTQWIGIQAIFGAFLLGMAMPAESRFVRHIADKMEDFILLFLLPIFFAYTGLRTQIGLLDNSHLWLICGLVVLTATGAKVLFSFLAARIAGLSWRHAGVLGALMNARGLVELIVLNIGLNLHVLSPQMFAIMVIMAVATTIITTPLLNLTYSSARQRRELAMQESPAALEEAHILVAVSSRQSAAGLARIGAWLLGGGRGKLCALHLYNPDEQEQRRKALHTSADPLELAIREADTLHVPVRALGFVSQDFAADILLTAHRYHCRWVVLGGHKGMLTAAVLGRMADELILHSESNVAILIEKNLRQVQRILVPYLGEHQDTGALLAADLISRHNEARVTILHVVRPGSHTDDTASRLGVQELVDRQFTSTDGGPTVRFQVIESENPVDIVVRESNSYDLIILGVSGQWRLKQRFLSGSQISIAQAAACSILAVHTVAPGAVPAAHTLAAGPARTAADQQM